MTDTQKPPMVVTLNNMGTAIVKPREYYDRHIYVHLDQFIDEVERRALNDAHKQAEASEVNMPYPDEDVISLWFRDTASKLAKEIKEGK